MDRDKWTTIWPEEEGLFWFYGYRYGKYFGDHKNKPELMLMTVHKISNGFLYSGKGQFIFKSEVEQAHFMRVVLPDHFPTIT